MKTIGSVVKRLRLRRGISQDKIQELTGGKINSRWLAGLETNKIKFSQPDKLETLAAALGTTVFAIYLEAGIISTPNPAGSDQREVDIIERFRKLSPELQDVAIQMLENLERANSVSSKPIAPVEKSNPPLENTDTSLEKP